MLRSIPPAIGTAIDQPSGDIDNGDDLSKYRAVRQEQISRLRRMGLVVLLALMLGQGGLLIHDVTFEHSSHDVCEICVALDRPVATPVVDSIAGFQPVFAALLLASIIGLSRNAANRTQRARAPPTL